MEEHKPDDSMEDNFADPVPEIEPGELMEPDVVEPIDGEGNEAVQLVEDAETPSEPELDDSEGDEVEPAYQDAPSSPEMLPEAEPPAQSSDAYTDEAELELDEPGLPRPDDEILLEAALFASTDLLSLRNLRELIDPALSAAKIQKLVVSINARLNEGKHPYEVVSAAGGWRLRTRPELYPWLRGLFKEVQSKRLSQAVLETLAVIAYKQPITKAEIEAVRGVSADGALKKLLEKRLVTVSGRTDTVGRPLTYGTTKEFLEYFGINKIPDDLPRLAEFEELVQSRSLLPQVAPGGVLVMREQDED